jgi:hypothetical protein
MRYVIGNSNRPSHLRLPGRPLGRRCLGKCKCVEEGNPGAALSNSDGLFREQATADLNGPHLASGRRKDFSSSGLASEGK